MQGKLFLLTILFLYGCASNSLRDDKDSFVDIKKSHYANNPGLLAQTIDQYSSREALLQNKAYAYRLARFARQTYPVDKDFALSLQKICFLLADAHSGEMSLAYALRGAQLVPSEKCDITNHAAAYYYGLNLGMILKEKGMFALDKLPLMHKALLCAVHAPGLDHGGPLRALGMLYLKAPAWPQGIGDIDKALELLKKAAYQYPAFPENNIFYAEALIENDQKHAAVPFLKKAKSSLNERKWGAFYTDRWMQHIQKLENKLK